MKIISRKLEAQNYRLQPRKGKVIEDPRIVGSYGVGQITEATSGKIGSHSNGSNM
jgi:hypothetical protein